MEPEPNKANFGEQATRIAQEAAAFQKIWAETFTKLMQTGFSFSPESAPPDLMRQIRSGIFRALADSWEQFLRSPQFLHGMKEWMEGAIAFRKMNHDFLTRMHHEMAAPSREDIDTVMLTVRHMEKRILDRLEELSLEVAAVRQSAEASPAKPAAPARAASRRRARTPGKPHNLTAP